MSSPELHPPSIFIMGMKRTETKPEVGRPEAFMAAEDVDLGDRPLASTQVQSPGIRRIEAITKAWNKTDKIWFIIGILLLTCE
jgi:hypothetical protein